MQEINDCWNKIGVYGDISCAELKEAIHCRNCRVYSGARLRLFERTLPRDYLQEWTILLSREKEKAESDYISVMVIRIGEEYFALPTSIIKEVSEMQKIHGIPHQKSDVLLGMVNVRGKIQLCFSLGRLLKIENGSDAVREGAQTIFKRMIVLDWEKDLWIVPVDETAGMYHLPRTELKRAPETVVKAKSAFTKGMLVWKDRNVALLDHELVLQALKRCNY